MPIEKPTKPTNLVPRAFGGEKNNFSEDLQTTGFEANIPQTYNGDNINYQLDATGKELDYVETVVDFINNAPVNHIAYVNENNQLDYIDKEYFNRGSYLGQTIFSLDPLFEDTLHLLDGALLQVGGIYDKFINNYIAKLYVSNPSRFCTETEWQTTVKTYGVCGKYVYTEGVSVRLPRVGNYLYTKETAKTVPVVGNGMTVGWTNGDGVVAGSGIVSNNGITMTKSSYGQTLPHTSSSIVSGISVGDTVGITTAPTKSGIIADLSNITTPLEGYYYIVVATGSKTDVEVNLDNIATDLNGKADTDLTNLSTEGRATGASLAMPSKNYIDLEFGASGSQYTAPANGWFVFNSFSASNARSHLSAENIHSLCGMLSTCYTTQAGNRVMCPAKKGDKIGLYYSNVNSGTARFIYAEGEV